VPQKLWPLAISEKLIETEIDKDDARAELADAILKNYEQTDEAYKQQMDQKQFQYLDIIPKSAWRNLVITRKLSPDSALRLLGVHDVCRGMVRELLINVNGLLHSYEDTYHIALLDDVSDPTDGAVKLLAHHLTQHFWTVKPGEDGKLSLIVTEWQVDQFGQQLEVNYHIEDADVARAFIGIFGNLCRKMPAHKLLTAKDDVTKYLNEQRDKLSKSYQK
jgi:hypothetical protein